MKDDSAGRDWMRALASHASRQQVLADELRRIGETARAALGGLPRIDLEPPPAIKRLSRMLTESANAGGWLTRVTEAPGSSLADYASVVREQGEQIVQLARASQVPLNVLDVTWDMLPTIAGADWEAWRKMRNEFDHRTESFAAQVARARWGAEHVEGLLGVSETEGEEGDRPPPPSQRCRWTARRRRIATPPGSRVLQLARFLCKTTTYENVFEAAVLDMRSDVHAALYAGDLRRARWVRIRFGGELFQLVLGHWFARGLKWLGVETVIGWLRG